MRYAFLKDRGPELAIPCWMTILTPTYAISLPWKKSSQLQSHGPPNPVPCLMSANPKSSKAAQLGLPAGRRRGSSWSNWQTSSPAIQPEGRGGRPSGRIFGAWSKSQPPFCSKISLESPCVARTPLCLATVQMPWGRRRCRRSQCHRRH